MQRKTKITMAIRFFLLLGIFALLFTSSGLAVTKLPTFPELKEGDELIVARKWESAESWYYDFIKANPNHGEGLRRLALVELRRPGGDVVRSQQYLERANTIEPDNSIGGFLLGKVLEVAGKRDQAKTVYDRLIEAGPGKDNPPRAAACHLARFNRGLMAAKDHDSEMAKDLFEQVLRREPQQAYATWELGLIAQEAGDLETAIEWGEKTVRNLTLWAPTEAWPYPQSRYGYIRENSRYELAKCLISTGRAEEAKELLAPIVKMAARRTNRRRGMAKPIPKSPLEGKPDVRFENSAYYYAEALAALGDKAGAKKVLKSYRKQEVGDKKMKDKARNRIKEL